MRMMKRTVRISRGDEVIIGREESNVNTQGQYGMKKKKEFTSSGARRPPLFSVVGMMSSSEREGRAFSGPAPNTLDSRTTGRGV